MSGLARNIGEWSKFVGDMASKKMKLINPNHRRTSRRTNVQDRAYLSQFKKSERPPAIEDLLQQILQISRAAGVHLILATQRPSVKIITGDIKANAPARVSFKLPTQADSRVILDE